MQAWLPRGPPALLQPSPLSLPTTCSQSDIGPLTLACDSPCGPRKFAVKCLPLRLVLQRPHQKWVFSATLTRSTTQPDPRLLCLLRSRDSYRTGLTQMDSSGNSSRLFSGNSSRLFLWPARGSLPIPSSPSVGTDSSFPQSSWHHSLSIYLLAFSRSLLLARHKASSKDTVRHSQVHPST